MRVVTGIDPETIRPDAAGLRLRLGIDDAEPVNARLATLFEQAVALFASLAAPAIVFERLTRDEFAFIYDGAGGNAPASPLESIYPHADRLALFTATLGPAIDHTILEETQRGNPALGYVLDGAASHAADRLAYIAAERFAAVASQSGSWRVLPYSPGYCGWHVSGQRALFARLQPQEIGVTLTASCLMRPLKSVSGVLVAGPPAIHRFRPTFPFCDACATHACRARMASIK